LNNEEIRQWIATVLDEKHYTENPDLDIVKHSFKIAIRKQENWTDFCRVFPTEEARIKAINAYARNYSYYSY
jgi:hypothetical protein